MSVHQQVKRKTILDIMAQKGKTPQVMLTAYTAPIAKLLDPYCDMLLVGDSLGMVVYGMETTLPVTLDMMINHGKAVMRGSSQALVVVDLPFASYQESPEQALRASARILAESGAAAVKLEGGTEMAETVSFLTKRGIPVMGHIGLRPQAVHTMGGFKAQGRGDEAAKRVKEEAKAMADSGAFSVVIEGTMEEVSREIAETLPILTIGIGASAACDGQVLVVDDILGTFSDFTPKFVKRYASLGAEIQKAAALYAEDVRARRFPGPEHCFKAKK